MRLISLMFVGVLAACDQRAHVGDMSDGDQSTHATQSELEAMCDAVCAHADRCPGGAEDDDHMCTHECASPSVTSFDLNSAFANAFGSCMDTADCTQRWTEACFFSVDTQLVAASGASPERNACIDRVNECGAETSLRTQDCALVTAASPDARAEFSSCLAGACSDVDDCLYEISF